MNPTYCARGNTTEPSQCASAGSPVQRCGSVWVSGWLKACADNNLSQWALMCRDSRWVSLLSLRPPALNATGLLYRSPPACRLKIDPCRGSDVISSTGEWSSTLETPRPVGFLRSFFSFFQRHKVDFALSVALETHLPLKEDQYTFMIFVSSSV